LISTFLVGFWVWTSYVLFNQKRGWKIYATKRKLRYEGNGLYESPTVTGALGEYKILAFTSDHSEYDARSQRRLTSIEISLNSSLPVGMAVASGGMVQIIQTLKLYQEHKPDIKGWDDSYIVRTKDKGIAAAYLTEKRLKTILELMDIPKAWIVLIFYEGGGLLRLDTPLPLSNPAVLDKMVKRLLAAAEVFDLEAGELSILQKKSKEHKGASARLEVDDEVLDEPLALELEEDEVEELVVALEEGNDDKDAKNTKSKKSTPKKSTKTDSGKKG
tara:strand:+ start:2104 stop:2925 length:822 start_codon:yes stop_codon:yes gene_type:complete